MQALAAVSLSAEYHISRGAAAVPASNHRTVPGMQQRDPACECLKDPGEH